MRNICLLLSLVVCCSISFAQSPEVIMTIDGRPVYKSEFISVYKKNNQNPDTNPEALREYMDLFVNYKLKVAEAERLGMDTAASFRKELAGYREQLAKPYLTDTSFQQDLLDEAYERLLEERRASHILVKIPGNGDPKDTLEAFKLAQSIIDQLKGGADFEALARKHSTDQSVVRNGGDLGYFAGLQMVFAFEDAVFNTEPGNFAGPIRTRYGYHVIKVTGKRPARGKVLTAHILIKTQETDKEEVAKAKKAKIDELYERIMAGEDFSALASRFSDDKSSARNGGELPWFGTGKMVDEFEEVSFSLQDSGQVSKPFRTQYGWHLVQLRGKRPVPSYEEMKPTLIRRITRDARSEMTRTSFLEGIKKEYGFAEYPKNLRPFYKWVNGNIFKGEWKAPAGKLDKPLATWADTTVTQRDFAQHLLDVQREAAVEDIHYFVDVMYAKYRDNTLMAYENNRLEDKYPEFKALMKEYRDGILLFDLTNEKVWNKAVLDTSGLQAFFDENRDRFMWEKRVKARAFYSEDGKVLKKALKMARKTEGVDAILKTFNKENKLNLRGEELIVEKGDHEMIDRVAWEKGASEILEKKDEFFAVYVDEVLDPQPKELDETRGAVISAYQNELEQRWLDTLRTRFEVEVNEDVLYSVK